MPQRPALRWPVLLAGSAALHAVLLVVLPRGTAAGQAAPAHGAAALTAAGAAVRGPLSVTLRWSDASEPASATTAVTSPARAATPDGDARLAVAVAVAPAPAPVSDANASARRAAAAPLPDGADVAPDGATEVDAVVQSGTKPTLLDRGAPDDAESSGLVAVVVPDPDPAMSHRTVRGFGPRGRRVGDRHAMPAGVPPGAFIQLPEPADPMQMGPERAPVDPRR